MKAGKEDGSTRRANAGATIRLHVARPFLCDLIESGSLNQLLTIDAKVALRDVITKDEDKVGFLGRDRGGKKGEEKDGDFHGLSLSFFVDLGQPVRLSPDCLWVNGHWSG
jgi:hypothetical protein